MVSTAVDRRAGLSANAGIKGPCVLASTVNLALEGLVAVDGVTAAEGDRILVRAQSDARENGVYIASTGLWQRAKDFAQSNDLAVGTLFVVSGGATLGTNLFILTYSGEVEIGATALTISVFLGTSAALLLSLLLTVDGAGSGLDADKLDGNDSSYFLSVTDALAAFQPLDADLTAIALLATTAHGRALLITTAAEDLRLSEVVPTFVTTLAALKALDTTKDSRAFYNSSLWVFTAGDYSAQITADTLGGIYAKANAIASATGSWVRQFPGKVNAKWFGATGDGATDDTAAINKALSVDASYTKVGVFLPGGTYMVGDVGGSVAITMPSNSSLSGAGIDTTYIKQKTGGDAHVINGGSADHWSVEHLTVDGNRANQTIVGIHCIRLGGCDDVLVNDVALMNAVHYNFGIQGGTNTNVRLTNAVLSGSGADAIDIKTKGSVDDADLTNKGVFLSNIYIKNFGNDTSLDAGSPQVGIDCRGIVHIANVRVENVGVNMRGIRIREGEAVDAIVSPNGIGGKYTTITNFYIEGKLSDPNGTGLDINHQGVHASNGTILSCLIGVNILQQECSINDVYTNACATGFKTVAGAGLPTDAHRTSFGNCTARSGTTAGFDLQTDSNVLSGCITRLCAIGYLIEAGSDNNKIGGLSSGDTSAVSDSGASTAIDVAGYPTRVHLVSSSLTLDSTGTKAASLTHGLGFTPSVEDCSVFLIRETAVTDPVFGYVWVESTSSTIVSVRARVTTASGTAGSTFKIGCKVEGKLGT